jgi:hypothetical protein
MREKSLDYGNKQRKCQLIPISATRKTDLGVHSMREVHLKCFLFYLP